MKIEGIAMIPGRKRPRPRLVRVVLFLATAMLFAVCLAQAGDGSALVTQRCLGCHGMEKNGSSLFQVGRSLEPLTTSG